MKRALMISLTAVLTCPMLASEPEPTAKQKKQQAAAAEAPAAEAPQLTSRDAAGADSPLVAAAKRARRGKPSGIVITNETLKTTAGKGRITTSNNASVIKVPSEPPKPTPEMVAAARLERKRKAAESAAAEKKTADAERKREAAARASEVEEGAGDSEGNEGYAEAVFGQPEVPPAEQAPPQH